jgi:hypothetical protein
MLNFVGFVKATQPTFRGGKVVDFTMADFLESDFLRFHQF